MQINNNIKLCNKHGTLFRTEECVKYAYNANGAMTQDLNKGISKITYNSLNLPVTLDIKHPQSEARNEYTYLATGEKLKVKRRWNPSFSTNPVMGSDVNTSLLTASETTDYAGNKIYVNGTLKKIMFDNGYYEDGMYYFYIRDHLGNNRIVADQNCNLIQSSQYYPFGMLFADGYGQDRQAFKYNNKELDMMSSLNLYDYGARFYDPAAGRFPTLDPLAEKYYWVSPYVYCLNNPVKYIDPDGRDIKIFYFVQYNKSGQEVYNSWTFNGTNQNQAPSNQFVQDFLTAYNYNVENGGGDNMHKLANSRDMTVKLRDGGDSSYSPTHNTIFWNPRWASTTKEDSVRSPATTLEHEMDHAQDYLTNPTAYDKRVATTDKLYDNKEERRVITGSEAKTAQANGEYPKGYTRTDHVGYGKIHVSDPTKTTPRPTMPPPQQQTTTSPWWDHIKQWWNN